MTHKFTSLSICAAPALRSWLKRGVPIACASAAIALIVFLLSIQYKVAAQSPGGTAADWLTYNGNFAGDRFSSLQEITATNVNRVGNICTFDTGETGSFQTGPIAVNGV